MALLDTIKTKLSALNLSVKTKLTNISTSVKTGISNFFALFKKDLGELWENHKLFFILCGVILVIIKSRDGIIDLLLNGAQREFDVAGDKDATLKAQEDAANNKANQLVQEAKDLNNTKKPIDENWNTKDEE